MFSNKVIGVGMASIVLTGLALFAVTVGLLLVVQDLRNEVLENRQTFCVSQYVDGERTSTQCSEYIDDFIADR